VSQRDNPVSRRDIPASQRDIPVSQRDNPASRCGTDQFAVQWTPRQNVAAKKLATP
jgi:hypothetical protein